MTSLIEIENAFFNHAADAGVIFTDRPLIADGVLHRVHVDGDKRGTKNGAYILHADGNSSGWLQHFNTGISGKWTLSGKREPMTKAMLEQIKADRERRQIEQQDRHNDAADKARFIWSNAISVKDQTQHPYLIKKNVQPHSARLYRDDALVIPIYDENKSLINLQMIQPDGTKRFLSGGRKKGCFAVIGKPDAGCLIQVCEGWATGASLNESTGHFTVVALDAGNLELVALAFRQFYPVSQIVICGDNDPVGVKAAIAAAVAVGGKYLLPATVGHDWNDELNREVA
ncbi:putative DNA primase/helicase [Methylobacter tundripaludum]|uniref:Putative DNA primase/helicase n=1 Tax=Methylobacter tundripaludum TaxID=173365 RepID=A0A2S6HIM8_9GAMM|nr:toprim domain-containing protein [Methylobacter tundripaludum]PPK77296.1 putative DNA primase/helicase [Methylobacter tundripaludum]